MRWTDRDWLAEAAEWIHANAEVTRAAETHTYATLPKLVEAGYERSRKVAQSTLPDKVVYELTDHGVDDIEEQAGGAGGGWTR
jgi:DNA-binding PadR family transcriptional regulator